MHTPHIHLTAHKVMLAILVGIIAVPITSTALFLQQESANTLQTTPNDLRKSALDDRSKLRAQRRLRLHSIHKSAPSVPDTAEKKDVVSSLTAGQLESHDKALLRRYTRAGFCPEGLKDFYIEGFYNLCMSLVGKDRVSSQPAQGLLNHNAYIYRQVRRAAPHSDLSPWALRMKMIDDAYNGTRRDGGVRPLRPIKCVMNPDCLTPRYSD